MHRDVVLQPVVDCLPDVSIALYSSPSKLADQIKLQPRGVKEVVDRDLEILPGICLIYRKSANWPPPPISQGVSISSEIIVCPLIVSVMSAEVLCKLRIFFSQSWDSRWTSGELLCVELLYVN